MEYSAENRKLTLKEKYAEIEPMLLVGDCKTKICRNLNMDVRKYTGFPKCRPGSGKSHLSIGLGMKAYQAGMNVRFYTAALLVNELSESLQNNRLSKLEKSLSKVDLLILDELSYLTFNRHQSELLFQVISERSERGSIIVTTNLEFSQGGQSFSKMTS